jgi:8-oxo-dGTP pyrophosphatase MutT (NUDIX family)
MNRWQKVRTFFRMNLRKNYRVDRDQVIMPSGKMGEYYVVRLQPHSVIIAIKPDGKILMVRQHRYPTDEITLELPMGNSDGGDLTLTARRELEEETGYTADEFQRLGKFQEANGIAEIWGHVFLARHITISENPAKDPEDKNLIELCAFTPKEIKDMIADGHITDASTICAYAIADYRGFFTVN